MALNLHKFLFDYNTRNTKTFGVSKTEIELKNHLKKKYDKTQRDLKPMNNLVSARKL